MNDFGSIVRFAYRSVRGSMATTLTVALTFSLGIGVTTAVFSIVYGVLQRPLPFPESDRLVRVWLNNPRQGIEKDITSYPNFLDWRAQSRSFEKMAAVAGAVRNLTGVGDPRELVGSAVSEGYFGLLGVAPVRGRVFTADEEGQGGAKVVLLSHELWATQFGLDPHIVGRTLTLNDEPYKVVGVMPPGLGKEDFWIPLRPSPDLRDSRSSLWLPVIGRLAQGVTLRQAQTEMSAIARRIEEANPQTNEGVGVRLEPLRASIVGDTRQPLLVLLGAVALVLLITCANIANVLLARGITRRSEMAMRSALGASRWRLATQVGTESLLMTFVGGVLGVLLAYAAVHALVAIAPPSLPRLDAIRLDGTVLAFAFGLTMLCGLSFGFVPALEAEGRGAAQAIKQGGRGAAGNSVAQRLQPVLVVSQFALAVMLLSGAGLMLRSFAKMQEVDPGFDADHVAVVRLAPRGQRYAKPEQITAFYDQVLASLRAIPGVQSAAGISTFVLDPLPNSAAIVIQGVTLPASLDKLPVAFDAVTPDLIATLRMRMLRGRSIQPTDKQGTPAVAVVSETFVRLFFHGEDPIGRRFAFGTPDNDAGWITIVGVTSDARRSGLVEQVRPYVFLPHAQYTTNGLDVMIRTAGKPLALMPQVRAAVRAIDSELPLIGARTLDQVFGETVASRRFLTVLLSMFGIAACTLAAIGIYGVMTYVVGRRTREIGVRVALGASPHGVRWLVIGEAMTQAGAGLGLGVLGALFLSGLLRAELFGVAPHDPVTLAATAAVLVLVALLASWLPARRAAAVPPIVAMRQE
jgi:putative ABC transport system permease protein